MQGIVRSKKEWAIRNRDYDAALAYAKEAVQLSSGTNNLRLMYDALNAQGVVQSDLEEFDDAASTLSQALSVAQGSGDKTKLLYGYMDLASNDKNRAFSCTSYPSYLDSYGPCYKAIDRAKANYAQSILLAKELGYAGLEKFTQDDLAQLETQRFLIQRTECIKAAKSSPNKAQQCFPE